MNKILLFIPMYNCEKQIIDVLKSLKPEIYRYLSEIIIVNNRSTDNGERIVIDFLNKNKFKIPVAFLKNDLNYGLGGSHKVAFDYAVNNNFDYIIVLHGDNQANIFDILPYLKNKDYEKYDCFLGARFMKGSRLIGYSKFRIIGNKIYNLLYSMVTLNKIYDLGSGLNMYKVQILKDRFYIKYKDNLTFNYCMILGSIYYKHAIKFFPISWSEDGQISNVKIINQAIVVLKLLFSYMFNSKAFIDSEHRDIVIDSYTNKIIYSNK